MSDKKPDFDSLDLSKLQKEAVAEESIKSSPEKKQPDKKASTPKEKSKTYNAWIDGIPIEDVTAEHMAEWIQELTGIQLASKNLDKPNKRVKAIDKVLHLGKQLSYLDIGHNNKDHKVYKH
jgi:hypothetical protein